MYEIKLGEAIRNNRLRELCDILKIKGIIRQIGASIEYPKKKVMTNKF